MCTGHDRAQRRRAMRFDSVPLPMDLYEAASIGLAVLLLIVGFYLMSDPS